MEVVLVALGSTAEAVAAAHQACASCNAAVEARACTKLVKSATKACCCSWLQVVVAVVPPTTAARMAVLAAVRPRAEQAG
jgi:hypothetical protein